MVEIEGKYHILTIPVERAAFTYTNSKPTVTFTYSDPWSDVSWNQNGAGHDMIDKLSTFVENVYFSLPEATLRDYIKYIQY